LMFRNLFSFFKKKDDLEILLGSSYRRLQILFMCFKIEIQNRNVYN
jgi:hypothetical protein